MFDIGFTEILVIGVVALIVIGPERLPSVARTLGHLLGRLQRYVGDVKSDIQREMQLEELKKLQAEIESQARGIEQNVQREMTSVEKDLNAPAESLAEAMAATGQGLVGADPGTTLGDFDPLKDVPVLPIPAAAETVEAAAAKPAAGGEAKA